MFSMVIGIPCQIGDMLFIIEKGVCDACKYLNDQEAGQILWTKNRS